MRNELSDGPACVIDTPEDNFLTAEDRRYRRKDILDLVGTMNHHGWPATLIRSGEGSIALHGGSTDIGEAKDALEYRYADMQTRERLAHNETVPWEERGEHVIAVGGDKLSRGLTLDGLSVSYYLRASQMYDTLMQMGRWFGYRDGYLDVCRIYTTQELAEWYRFIASASV